MNSPRVLLRDEVNKRGGCTTQFVCGQLCFRANARSVVLMPPSCVDRVHQAERHQGKAAGVRQSAVSVQFSYCLLGARLPFRGQLHSDYGRSRQ
jgi:hypothetical protein